MSGRDKFLARRKKRNGGNQGGPQGGDGDNRGGGRSTNAGGSGDNGESSSRAFAGAGQSASLVALPKPNATQDAGKSALSIGELENKLLVEVGTQHNGKPLRSTYGKAGTETILRTNFFAIEVKKSAPALYQYTIEVEENPGHDLSKPQRRNLIKQLLATIRETDLEGPIATDFGSFLVTTQKLDPTKDEWVFNQGLYPNGHNHRVTVRYKTSFSIGNSVMSLRAETVTAPDDSGAIVQMLNIITAKNPNDNERVSELGGNKFYPYDDTFAHGSHMALGGGLVAIRGYFASVRPAVGRLLLNLNVTSGAFYSSPKDSMGLMALWNEIVPLGGGPDQRKSRNRRQWEKIEIFCRNIKFYPTHLGNSARPKTFWSFCRDGGPEAEFLNALEMRIDWDNGEGGPSRQTTIAQYYQQKYGISLAFPELPLINVVKANQRNVLPPELAGQIVPCQPYRGQLGPMQTKSMLKFAARKPNENAESIAGNGNHGTVGAAFKIFGLTHPDSNTPSAVKEWGFLVNPTMLTVPARILKVPQIEYGSKDKNRGRDHVSPQFGSWNASGKKFYRPGSIGIWAVLSFDHDNMIAVNAALPALHKHLVDCGIRIIDRLATYDLSVRGSDNDELKLIRIKENLERMRPYIALIVLREQDKTLYHGIKQLAEIDIGVQTICCLSAKLTELHGRGTYFGNLALKFNLKGGGMAHTVRNIEAPFDKETMLMGIDVTHPSPGNAASAPSIAAVVASTSPEMCNWPGSIRVQDRSKNEIVDALQDMCIERLNLWQATNGKFPKKIIVFRDGVSEGQYDIVRDEEIGSLERAITSVCTGESKPKLTVIIVGKRHHVRFFPTDHNKMPMTGNAMPGTVVDRGITQRGLFEFYLQSHQAIQGTGRPAHYVVLRDDNNLTADGLQQFTYQLCHLFHRATKSVSICPPAYYADLLAERGRCYLRQFFHQISDEEYNSTVHWSGGVHENLRKTTWYI